MDPIIWYVIIGAAVIGGLLVIARMQSGLYRGYLEKHVAETAKMVDSQRRTLEAVDRQTAALERIADALSRDRA